MQDKKINHIPMQKIIIPALILILILFLNLGLSIKSKEEKNAVSCIYFKSSEYW